MVTVVSSCYLSIEQLLIIADNYRYGEIPWQFYA